MSNPVRTQPSGLSILPLAGSNHTEVGEPRHRTSTFSVVICGEAGSGKSSLVNLITGRNIAVTSSDAGGCTTAVDVHDSDILNGSEMLKVKLFDTPGLDEGPRGTVPDKEARRILKKLLRTLTQQGNNHLIVYCVRGEREIRTLRRNYELIRSQVKRKFPIVLVVTCLESYQPEMEDWWRVNEPAISNMGMTFAGHACITTATMKGPMFLERRTQSYNAVHKLFEQCRPSNITGVHTADSPMSKNKTIVVFGAKGAGKSSLINLMEGKDVADSFCGIEPCTNVWQEYPVEFSGESYRVFDTVGLPGETYEVFNTAGANESRLEFSQYLNACKLVQTLEKEGGIDLLVFCVSGTGKLNAMHQNNYRFFYEFLCGKKVPVVLAITKLEREPDMESWWTRNQKNFLRKKIRVNGHVCITTIKAYSDLREKSRKAIWNLVKNVTADQQKRAREGANNLFRVASLISPAQNGNLRVRKDVVSYLIKRCHMSPEVAKLLASRMVVVAT
ncbi:uncharacterized protein EDB93DRAFT_1140431 [Suillus bovinus]|uniref:uncharacterized protein n=1 Tax=Suillus bovinus TaxID=48563 RepID=UPI001B86B04F|nr:uncharacterized protein EDB93DRAFT_1140431 [Suillus bovinus]KAG2151276.1 hypothetical protein EDB93DRAFT_1140431 [Suillus bovinus]